MRGGLLSIFWTLLFFLAIGSFCKYFGNKLDDSRARKYKETLKKQNPNMSESELEEAKIAYRKKLAETNFLKLKIFD